MPLIYPNDFNPSKQFDFGPIIFNLNKDTLISSKNPLRAIINDQVRDLKIL